MRVVVRVGCLLSVFLLGGCANGFISPQQPRQMGNLLLAEPAPMSARSQMALARLNHVLAKVTLTEEQRAELIYQRAMLYDSLGLAGLANFDFQMALKLKPDMAEAYNYIGIHHTQSMEFMQAYEAFDSTLDIDPEHDFAFLNRGIALYYGGRPRLAVQDLSTFKAKDLSDPYRALWAYFAEYDVDPEMAKANLRASRAALNAQHWANALVDLFLGETSEEALLDRLLLGVENESELTDRLCEAYFYLGKFHVARGNQGVAANYFKLALSTNVYQFVEHRYARLELALLHERSRAKPKP